MSTDAKVPWPIAVSFLIRPLDESFTLSQVYDIAAPLHAAFPDNRHVEAKIRQSLQVLRDRGRLAFTGRGVYRKLHPDVAPSVKIDFSEAARFTSRSQVARVAVEAWAAYNVVCWRCRSPLLLVPANTPLLDAVCRSHGHEVQIKSFAGPASDIIVAAAYQPLVTRLETRALPDYLIISYDRLREAVLLAEFVDGSRIGPSRIASRAPLASTARRAGWIGSTISLEGLERSVVVGPSLEPEIERWASPVVRAD